MAATIESHGEIEIICESVADLTANKLARIVFRAYADASPPFQIRVRSPQGRLIVERVLRELPTGEPQSPPPVTFTVQKGDYEVRISQLKGKAEGRAVLSIRS